MIFLNLINSCYNIYLTIWLILSFFDWIENLGKILPNKVNNLFLSSNFQEAAFDADKIFLAAIDKFDAMMSKGNVYAPDGMSNFPFTSRMNILLQKYKILLDSKILQISALFRWAVVLQQRSRLRPSNSKEKLKLLQQAKRLYEDALHMDSGNLQARDALLSCMSELEYGDF